MVLGAAGSSGHEPEVLVASLCPDMDLRLLRMSRRPMLGHISEEIRLIGRGGGRKEVDPGQEAFSLLSQTTVSTGTVNGSAAANA